MSQLFASGGQVLELQLQHQPFFFLSSVVGRLNWVFLAAHRLSLVVGSGGYSLVAGHQILIVVASLILQNMGSRAQAQ